MLTAIRWPFVGRLGELEQFTVALGDDRFDTLLVTGSSGVGKSRLARECRRAPFRWPAPACRSCGAWRTAGLTRSVHSREHPAPE